jgi:hypothetical protein
MERRARKGFGGRPRKHEPEAGERVHLGIRVTPQMKQRLEEVAASTGRSQSQEAEYRLERSFDRSHLLGEVLELAFGKRLAGFLLALGFTMMTAGAGRLPYASRDDWTLEMEPYYAAKSTAEFLLSLWEPTRSRTKLDDIDASLRAERQRAVEAVEILISLLKEEMAAPKAKEPIGTILDLLGRPIAMAMIEQFPEAKKRRAEADELAIERKVEASSRRKAS